MANPILIKGVFDIGKTLISRIFPDKKEQAEAELKMLLASEEADLKELETRLSAILAEANSKDPWTSRARPSFLYVVYVFILSAIPMGFISAYNPELASSVAAGAQAWLNAIPGELYTLFGAGYLGYSYNRTQDKKLFSK